jgi:hypothetical protein
VTPEHLAFPFRFVDGVAVAVEQDSPVHMRDRVVIVCRTPRGSRLDDPKFGIPDQLLRTPGVDIGALAAAIEASEPDIAVRITRDGDDGHDRPGAIVLADRIHVHVEEDG